MIRDGFFTPGSENEFKDLVDMLLHHDRFLTLADFRAYVTSQELVSEVYRDQARYSQSGEILNKLEIKPASEKIFYFKILFFKIYPGSWIFIKRLSHYSSTVMKVL